MKPAAILRSLATAILLSVTAIGVASAQVAVSDAKIHAFLSAAVSVNEVIEEWTPRVEGAESQEAANDLKVQANAEIKAVIEGTDGISADEYMQIAQAARTDPELSARIEKIYKESFSQ